MNGVPRAAIGVCVGIALGAATACAAATLEVTVEGVEPGPGSVYVSVCQGSLTEAACAIGDSAPARGGALRFVFGDVEPGRYAVAAFEDLNANRRLDRTGLGLPLEPYAFSGETGRRGRPDFAGASFALREPGTTIRVRLARALPPR